MHIFETIGFPIFLPIFIIVASLIAHNRSKENTAQKKVTEDFLERERRANSTRKQDISGLDYIVLNLESLPMGKVQDDMLQKYEDTLTSLSREQILNLTGKSNTDLKLLYGPANLDTLLKCDENYHILSKTLLSYAKREQELDRIPEAITILEYASLLQIDISQIYILLASLYEETGQKEKISNIRDSLASMDESFCSYVLNKLEAS